MVKAAKKSDAKVAATPIDAMVVAGQVWQQAAELIGPDLERKAGSKNRWRSNARQIARTIHERRTRDKLPLPGPAGSLEDVQRIVYRYMRALYATDTDKFCLPEHVPGSRTMRADATETHEFIGLRAKIPNYVKKAGGGFTITDDVAKAYTGVAMPDDLDSADLPVDAQVDADLQAEGDQLTAQEAASKEVDRLLANADTPAEAGGGSDGER